MDLSTRPASTRHSSLQPTGTATPPPYDPLLPSPSLTAAHHHSPSPHQISPYPNPVSMDTPTETPHDLFCLAKEYERRARLQDAANLYLKASMNGHLSAMVAYATHLVPTDERAAFVWFRAAAERGDPRAWYELGQLLARGRYFEVNAVDAARCWKRAAQMGDNTGKSALGLCYIRGFGVKQDLDKGVEIVKQVADVHNDVTAMKNLAWIFRYGKGVPKNLQEAEYWDDRAKEQERVMTHITSREQALFGRTRSSRHSRNRARDSEKSSRSATRENSTSERAPAANPSSSARDREPSKTSKHLVVDELEHRLRDVSEHQKAQSAASDDASLTLERSMSPNPVRGAHLPAGVEGSTEPPVHPLPQQRVPTDSRPTRSVTAPVMQSSETRPPVITDQYRDQSKVRKLPDPVLGAEVAHLSFIHKPDVNNSASSANPQPIHGPLTEDAPLQASPDHRTMQYSAAEATVQPGKPPLQGPVSAYPSQTPTSGRTTVEKQVNAPFSSEPLVSTKDNLNIQMNPREDGESSNRPTLGAVPGAAAAVLATATATVAGVTSSGRKATASASDTGNAVVGGVGTISNGLTDGRITDATIGATNTWSNQSLNMKNVTASKDTSKPVSRSFLAKAPKDDTLGPSVRSRKAFFEGDKDMDAKPGAETVTASRSYALAAETATAMKSSDLDEFENADIQRVASTAVVPNEESYVEEPQPYSAPPARPEDHAPRTATAKVKEVGALIPAVDDNASLSVAPGKGHGNDGDSSFDMLRAALLNYPPNPMRVDAQAALLKLLMTIQEIPASSAEAHSIIEHGSGYSKIIVAMISQHDDEQIQEHGLHCFVRFMRATSTGMREKTIMSPYADCFKDMQGNADVIVPKGTVAIEEGSTGAIQAVVHAMRRHATIRRIQLAGCAALTEIGSVSFSCRSLAYEHGAINLLLACLRHRSTAAAAVIHDMAGRAVSSFCAGKENMAFKEAFTNAGAVSELLSVLQLWGHVEDAISDILISATNSCCSALRHLTDGFAAASVQCVQSFAYHHLVRIMVLRREDVSICTAVLAAMTSVTRNAGSSAEKALMDAKPLPEVLSTMQVHSENALLIRKALDFMESLGSFSTMKEEIVVAGGIPFAADIIQQGGSDALLLERACGVVEKLCRLSTPNQEIFISNGGVQSLTKLLGTHQRLPGVVERALLALTSVCANSAVNQREAVGANSPEELVRVLSVYSSKNAKVVAAAVGAMSALVVPKNLTTAQTFAGLKAPELVVRAMKRHPDSVMVQENGSAAIAAFCEADPHIMTSLLKSGITTILVVGLQRFLHRPTAVVQIVRAMRAITNEAVPEDSYRFKSKLLTDRSNESSLAEIFHTALSYHKKSIPDTANIIISICATINRLCMRSVAFKNEVGKDGIVEELRRLIERTAEFKDLGALQPVLATICTLVLESEENKNRFHSAGGVEAILDVMQKWKHDTYVLEHCCAALRYSCNDHFGNCDEVKNHNGVRSILGVMEMHPENVNVTLWCCLTLADLCKGDEELQSSATVVQGIRKVVSAMSMFSQNSRFLASACEFLRAASVCNVDNQERIVRLGGRSAIVKALETHPTDNTLTESAAYALLQIQDIADPRASLDSAPQVGLVKRLSRDLRRSGSSSNRSNRSSKGKIGRKSLSFSSRRRTSNGNQGEGDEDEEDEQAQETRGNKTTSLINLHRLIPRRKSRMARSAEPDHVDVDEQDNEETDQTFDDYDEQYDKDVV